jgi:hypothetical protein
MHFEILVEDQSGKRMLDFLVPRIIATADSFTIRAYKGVGRIPPGLRGQIDASKRILLDRLPALLRGYGKAFNFPAAVIVVCDLDSRCLKRFRQELLAVLDACDPRPETRFCSAVEEGEAFRGKLRELSGA